jgi:hypothetical protein
VTTTVADREDIEAFDVATLEDRVVILRLRGWSLEQIAEEVGHDRSTVARQLKHVQEGRLEESTLASIRAWELLRLDVILERIWPLLDPDDPDATPDLEAVWAFLAVSRRRSALVGRDLAPARTAKNGDRAGTQPGQEPPQRAERLRRMVDLVDKMTTADLGFGRCLGVEVNEGNRAC